MQSKILIFSFLFLIQIISGFSYAYDRCDDVCRVLNKEGGQCQEDARGHWHCICLRDDFIADHILPNACDFKNNSSTIEDRDFLVKIRF